MDSRVEIGTRLRQFGESKFGSMAEFARALEMKPQSLQSYLGGRVAPGRKMESRLEALGCDLIWLRHGLDRPGLEKRFAAMVQRVNQQAFTEEEKEIVAILRTLGITNRVDFHLYFDYARAVQDKIERDKKKDRPTRMSDARSELKAAEGTATYKRKGK